MQTSSSLRRMVSFLSTPSARRATRAQGGRLEEQIISIHALREEGDRAERGEGLYIEDFYPRPPRGGRRGDLCLTIRGPDDFYPRPPRGGRHGKEDLVAVIVQFLSTPSARRATSLPHSTGCGYTISIHALREEGDGLLIAPTRCLCNFYPRPPRGGRHKALYEC